MSWVLLSIVATFALALFQLVNQYAKVDGFDLAVVAKSLVGVVFLPVILIVGLPDEPLFYLFALLSAPLGLYCDRMFFNLAAEYGGGPVSRVVPLNIILIFIIWLVLHPELAVAYFGKPLVLSGIVLSLGSAVYFSMRMRKCALSMEVFKKCIPLIVGFALLTIINKEAMDHSSFHQGVHGYIFFQGLIAVFFGLPWIAVKRRKDGKPFVSMRLFKASLLVALAVSSHLVSKNYAYSMVDDPTFPTAIILTSPLFILAYYRLTNHREFADIRAGLGVLASVIVLVLLKGL